MDATLLQPMRFGLGFMASMDNRASGGDSLLIGETAPSAMSAWAAASASPIPKRG